MKNKILVLAFSFILFSNLLVASNSADNKIEISGLFAKTLGYISQSKPVCWCSKNIIGLMRPNLGSCLASSQYQALGKEAQEALGIPQNRILPIKKMITGFPQTAEAMTNAICVNEEKINKRSFGAQRTVFFHEACHVKYNDIAFATLSGLTVGVLGGRASGSLLKAVWPTNKYTLLHGATHGLMFVISYYITERTFLKFAERRADTEGCYASQCATCVEEQSHYRSCRKNNKGYLSSVELALIASDLKAQNKYCSYHRR